MVASSLAATRARRNTLVACGGLFAILRGRSWPHLPPRPAKAVGHARGLSRTEAAAWQPGTRFPPFPHP